MTGDKDSGTREHHLKLTSRSRLEMTGIDDVSSFDEQGIILRSCMGGISVEGEELKIESFSTLSGGLEITGKINGIFYFNMGKNIEKEKTGLFSRMFK